MEIKKMNESTDVVFDDIASGTVFEHFDIIYMKMHNPLHKVNNAVRLNDGEAASFYGDMIITPLDVELVIK